MYNPERRIRCMSPRESLPIVHCDEKPGHFAPHRSHSDLSNPSVSAPSPIDRLRGKYEFGPAAVEECDTQL